MKKLLLPLVLLLTVTANAQMWMDIGVRAGYNSTWLLSQNVLDDQHTKMALCGAPTGGVKLGINFSEQYGITLDGIYTKINQNLSSQGLTTNSWEHDYKLDYISMPLLFRNSRGGTYVEIGPQISFLTSASESYSSTPANAANFTKDDAKDRFENVNYAAVLGFGSYMMGFGDNLYLTMGFRAAYGLNDIISNAGGKGQNYQPIDPKNTNKSLGYSITRPLVIGFNLELDFDFGYLVEAHCGRKQFLLFD